MNIKLGNCRGQYYDGASTMSVAKVIALKKSRAIFTHCYDHPLNLGVGDTIKQCQLMNSALEVVSSSDDRGGNRDNLPGPRV